MGILREFEQRLEGAVEGLFARAFKSGVQPVELGKRLVRAVEDGRTVGVSRVYVPNVYTYELSTTDRERFADYEDALANELAALAVQTARDNDWAMLGPATLVLMSGPHEVKAYPLSGTQISIGRSERSDIALADPGVSRNHARIVREGDDFIVEDLGSTNGTEVNGQPVRRRRLADGDMVKLANSTLQFRRER